MTWYAIFEAGTTPSNSEPISSGEVIDTNLLTQQGRTSLALPGDPRGQVWSRPAQAFVPPPAPVTVLTKVQFIQRFTPTEFAGLQNSTDPNVRFFMFQLNNALSVTPSDTAVQNGLNYCASIGLLTAARVAVLGAS